MAVSLANPPNIELFSAQRAMRSYSMRKYKMRLRVEEDGNIQTGLENSHNEDIMQINDCTTGSFLAHLHDMKEDTDSVCDRG